MLRGAVPSRVVALLVPLAMVTVAAQGCEAIVPGSLPDFSCQGAAPGTCPPGYYCRSPQCVPCDALHCGGADGGGADATTNDGQGGAGGDGAANDGPGTTDSPPPIDGSGCGGALGCPCNGPGDCTSHLCGDASVLTSTFTTANGSVCTAPCCTSADCPGGFVCDGAGTGGSFCVEATKVGRPVPGAAAAGAACGTPGDCRSGDCYNNICEDACCKNSDCASGTTCSLTSNVFAHTTWVCSAHAGSASGASCSGAGTTCASDVCSFSTCRPHCCGAGSVTPAYNACALDSVGTDAYSYADYPGTDQPTGAAFGAACSTYTDCKTRTCNTAAKTCTDICCVDSDCAAYGTGLVCRPGATGQTAPATYLVCVQGP